MNRQIMVAVAFVISAAIVLAILQYVIHMQGAILKLIIGVVVGLIVAGIVFAMTGNSANPSSPTQ